MPFLLLFFSFLLGALPLSVWVTKLAGKDPRAVGDKNPGATNALKAGGKWVGLAALLLDVSKSAAPVGMAYQILGLDGPWMAAIALAPSLGHAYSPFLRFKGGKALATVLGAWIGLTLWDVPLVALGGITLWFLLLKKSGWAVVFTLLGMTAYLYFFRPESLFFWVLGLQSVLLVWKHRFDLVIGKS
jgi:acyl phosphate:glycerol-3-phosphate acyltransferase